MSTIFEKVTRSYGVAATWLRWKWRLGHIGSRTILGRCRRTVHPASISIGRHVTVADDWMICDVAPQTSLGVLKVRIGDHCTILDEFQCNAAESVEIQHHVLMAGRVFISDSDHIVDPDGERTTCCTRLVTRPVVIEHDCWLGQNAVILKGVRVGHHTIVAANAVVTRDVEPCSIVAGVPARVIGSTRAVATLPDE